MFRGLYIVVLLLFVFGNAQGQETIVFSKETGSSMLTGRMLLFEDKTGTLGIEDILKGRPPFTVHDNPVPGYSSTRSAIWLKAKLKIDIETPVYLQMGYPMMDTIEMFIVDEGNNIVEHGITGAFLPIKDRDLLGNYPKFQIRQGIYTYYIRVKATYSILLPIHLKSFQTLYRQRLAENITQGAYIGFAILIVLYTFFLWVSLRDKVYIYYILHSIGTAIITLHIGGYTFLMLWPGLPQINYFEPSIYALNIFSLLFAIVFLETAKRFKKLHSWLVITVVINCCVFPLDWLGMHRAANYLVQATGVWSCLLLLAAGIVSYQKGFKSARFFLLAWSVFLVGVIITLLQRAGVLYYNYYLMHAWQIGSAIEMVLLSLALADRINILRDEKEKALEQNFINMRENRELVQQQNALLSLRVEERTKELNEQHQTLEKQKAQFEELNNTKDKIFSVIAHDLRGPLANVSQLAEMMSQHKELQNEETLSMLKEASNQSFNLLENLLLWAKAQYGDADFQKDKIELNKLAENTRQLYHLKALAKDIKVENNIPVGLYASADATMIDTVIRNLVSNSLKYTLVGGKIEIGGRHERNNTVSVWVKDSGLGIAPEKLPRIFEAGKNKSILGTGGETGTGLGLIICKDFVEKNNGAIAVQSQPGKGTTFTITLPGNG